MTFVIRMALREARASWRRLIFFFLCVAVGVGAIVALRSVVQTARDGMTREARALIASDVQVQSNRQLAVEDQQELDALYTRMGVTTRTSSIETPTMVRPEDPGRQVARMVELLGVEAKWPLYGTVSVQDQPYSHALLRNRGALVRPELLTQIDLTVGSRIVIGTIPFTIRGVLLAEPGRRLGFFSLGPRVIVDLADLRETGLLQFGSRARFITLLEVPEPRIQALVTAVRGGFGNRFVTARSYRSREDQIGEDFDRAENYLSLVGFVIVVLGGIGVWSVTRVFVRQKIKSIAVLKCVGASTGQVLGVYVVQVVLLGLAGSLVGVALAALGLWLVPAGALVALGDVALGLTLSATVQGVGVGLLVSLLFSLVPLLEIRRVRPLTLLRDEAATTTTGSAAAGRPWRVGPIDWVQVGVGSAVLLALVALASWQAASLRVGTLVCGGFVVVAVVLHLAGTVLVRLVRPLVRVKWFPLRHAVISFGRPGNQTRVVLMAVGLGAFFIIGVRAMQVNLERAFSVDLRAGGADMFLIDIQPDQVDGLRGFLAKAVPGESVRLIAVLRARVIGVEGRNVQLDNFEDVRGQGALAREYTVTFRDRLEANERIVSGTFWTGTSTDPEVSIEESIRQRFGIDVGDRVRFDVLGRAIQARVGSVRHVDWGDARAGGFMFVFRPGALDRAPHTFIAIFKGPAGVTQRARLQRDLVTQFANVSAIDAREITKTIEAVLANVTLAISIVGGVALFSGVLILIGAVAMTKFERLREAAIFKTLGASSRTLATMLALEYGTLGALAGVIGSLGAVGLSWLVCRLLLDIAWQPAPGLSLIGMAVTTVTVGAVGVLASLDVLRRRPLSTLRAE